MNQEASLEDDILQFGQSKDLTFHQVSNIKTYDNDYADSEGFLIGVYIRADKFYDSYERKVTDILTLLGDLGGLLQFLVMIGGVLVAFLSQKLFMASIIKKIYHIRKYENIEHEA